MLELFKYNYYWVLVKGRHLLLTTLFYFVPVSIFENKVKEKLEPWGIKISSTAEKGVGYDKSKFSCEMVIHNKAFYKKFVSAGQLYLGETYMVSLEFGYLVFPP